MAIRKNLRFKGASAASSKHYADKGQARYQRKQAEAWGPWLCQRTRGLAPLELGIELHTATSMGPAQRPAPGRGFGVGDSNSIYKLLDPKCRH